MAAVLRYFWFICAAVMLANVAIWRGRLRPLVATGRISAAECEGFTRGAVIWLVGPCLLLGLIALWAGYVTPLCAGMFSFRDAPRAATSVVILFCWAVFLWWIWLRGGAEFLARVWGVLGKWPNAERTYSPRVVRLVITGALLFSAVGAAVMYRAGPIPPEVGCQLPPIAE